MGRLLKYGTTAGLKALRDANVTVPDAICTGTGFGLLDDSGKFLKSVTEANEGVVSPTSFIQSTHNTVSSNIALIVGCKAHNNTFVHKGFSFESALTDAELMMGEQEGIKNVLTGAYDETTDYSYDIMRRLRLIRQDPTANIDLYKYAQPGTITGEGAAFFVMSKERSESSYAKYRGNAIVYNPASAEVLANKLNSFLESKGMTVSDVDVVLSGLCGDAKRDEKLNALNDSYLKEQTILGYKHLCGEYMTSSAFALWMATMIAKTGEMPKEAIITNRGSKAKNLLICNAYKKGYSFILLSAL
jgi:3-oxoacyl-(acyl-carrier-protein) synthase